MAELPSCGIDNPLNSRLFARVRGQLLGTIRVDTEKFEGALLDRGWPGVKGEEVFLVEGGGGVDAAIGAEVGEEGLEAVHCRRGAAVATRGRGHPANLRQ